MTRVDRKFSISASVALLSVLSICFLAGCVDKVEMENDKRFAKALKALENTGSASSAGEWKNNPEIFKQFGKDGAEFHRNLSRIWAAINDGVPENVDRAAGSSRFSNLLMREKGREYIRAVDTKKAMESLNSVNDIFGKSPVFVQELGESIAIDLQWKESLKVLYKASGMTRSPIYVYFLIEALEGDLNRYGESLKAARAALKVNPMMPYFDYREGRACAVLQDYECAIKAYLRIAEIHPKSAYQLADAYFVLGNYKEAARWYEKLLASYPDYRLALTKLAETYMSMGEYEKAEEIFRRDIARKPEDVVAYTLLGNTFLLAGKPEQALDALDNAIAINDNLPRAHELRAKCYLDLGRVKDAEIESKWIFQYPKTNNDK